MWAVSSISLLELRVAEFTSFGDRTDVLVSILGPLPCSKPAVENQFLLTTIHFLGIVFYIFKSIIPGLLSLSYS